MRRHLFIYLLAAALIALPMFCIAQSSGTGTEAASGEPSSSCARIQLGAIGSETEETTDQTQTGTGEDAYTDYQNYQQTQTQEGEGSQGAGTEGGESAAATGGQTTEEWNCNEELNADGTLTCFKPSAPDVPVICTVEGENVFCPE